MNSELRDQNSGEMVLFSDFDSWPGHGFESRARTG